MKGEIQANIVGLNRYTLSVLGLVDLTPVAVTGLDDVLETTSLPDRTVASGGQRKSAEFTMDLPAHHVLEQLGMEGWFIESQDPISPTYKKTCTYELIAQDGKTARAFTLIGVFPVQRKLPAVELKNEGDMAVIQWVMSVDNILPI